MWKTVSKSSHHQLLNLSAVVLSATKAVGNNMQMSRLISSNVLTTSLASKTKLIDLVIFFVQLMLSAVPVEFVKAPTTSSINGSDPSTNAVGLVTRHRRRSSFVGYGGDSDSDSDLIDQTSLTSKRFEGE